MSHFSFNHTKEAVSGSKDFELYLGGTWVEYFLNTYKNNSTISDKGSVSLTSQPLTEMSTRNIKIIMFLGSKVQPVHRPDNLTAIYEPIVQTMWDPQHLTTL
jgi:hypothetical protein